MARRQAEIPGTERTDVPQPILEAAASWFEKKREKKRIADKTREAFFGVVALMESHKVPVLRVQDPDTEEYVTIRLEHVAKLLVKKTGEAAPEPIGQGVASGGDDVKPGLVRQVEKEMAANGVAESDDGDVVVPDTAAPKGKKKRGGKPAPEAKGDAAP